MPGYPDRCRCARLSILVSALCLFVAAACGAAPSADLPASPQPILVIYRPAAQAVLPELAACAANYPTIAIYAQPDVRPLPEIRADPEIGADLILYLGDDGLSESAYTATLLGYETLVVIVNANNPLASLTRQELQAIYTGETNTWQVGDQETEIQAWTYATQEGARHTFENAVLGTTTLTNRVLLAASPQAMLEAIASEANAIGYLPGSWLLPGAPAPTEGVHAIRLDETIANQLRLPVLALTPSTPQGMLQAVLLCLQEAEP